MDRNERDEIKAKLTSKLLEEVEKTNKRGRGQR